MPLINDNSLSKKASIRIKLWFDYSAQLGFLLERNYLQQKFLRMLMLSSKPKHCTSTQLEVIDDLHREEIEILNDFMRVLPNSDDDQIDE